MPYDTKKYIQNYQMKVICNKEHMINCYQLKKIEKKEGCPKNYVKVVKNEKNVLKIGKNW